MSMSARAASTTAAGPSTAAAIGGGGVWEVVVDRAALEVAGYLGSSTRPFDPTGPLSPHMFALLSRSTLRDIVLERNGNGLCGRLGCAAPPRGLPAGGAATTPDTDAGETAAAATFWGIAPSPALRNAGDDDDDSAQQSPGPAVAREGNIKFTVDASAEAAEIEYDDDVRIAESFRLVRRDQQIISRLKEEKEKEALRQRRALQQSPGASSPPPPQGHGTGASLVQHMFCSPTCTQAFQDGILSRVPAQFVYDHEQLLHAIGSLFPNLRPDTLRQLAGLEVPETRAVKSVVERAAGAAGAAGGLAPVTTGGPSAESTLTRATAVAGNDKKTADGNTSSGTGTRGDECPPGDGLGTETTRHMARRDDLWDAAVVYRMDASNVFRSGAGSGAPAKTAAAAEAAAASTAAAAKRPLEVGAGSMRAATKDGAADAVWPPPAAAAAAAAAARRPPPRGPLLVMDFLMSISSARARNTFLLFYVQNRSARDALAAAAQGTASAVYSRLVAPACAELDARAASLPGGDDDGVLRLCFGSSAEPRVDPAVQQQRRDVVAAQLFSSGMANALSRLLWVDVGIIVDHAWHGVWHRAPPPLPPTKAAAASPPCQPLSLLDSLVFPFAVPSVVARSLGEGGGGVAPAPEVVALGLVFLLAAAMCHAPVERALRDAAEQVEEVLYAIDMTEEDIAVALRALLVSPDDD